LLAGLLAAVGQIPVSAKGELAAAAAAAAAVALLFAETWRLIAMGISEK
jgi:hypothetical protein